MGFLESKNLEPEEILQVQLRGFEKDVCFYSVLALGSLLGYFLRKVGLFELIL